MNNQISKKWRTTVIKRLISDKRISCTGTIQSIRNCGTAVLRCGKEVKSGISRHTFEALHHF